MEFRELKTFQVVAGLLSFNKAANILHMAQSTVSAQIRSLENSLDKKLFIRSGKTVSLTTAGEKLLSYTQRLVNIEKEIQSVLGNLDDKYGILTIKTPQSVTTHFFPELIKEFQLIFPKIGFDIDWCTSFNLLDIFNSGTIDLAFLITDEFKDKNLEVEELADVKMVLATHAEDKLSHRKRISVKELHNKTLVFAKSDCNYKNILEKVLIQHNVVPGKVININSIEAIKQLLLLGNCIAFLPEMLVKNEIDEGKLKTINLSGVRLIAKLVMIWSDNKHISNPLKAFMMMVRKKIHDQNL